MSERKVLNKYYPPDFDPSKIPRMKLAKNRQYTVRLMAPFNMRCATCGEYIYKGKKFNARKEDVENDDYLGVRIYRFYIKCTRCLQEISFKTDPKNTDYEIEAGATRNFMALKLAEEQAQREEDELKEEEATNPMKLLENRTQQSKNEIDLLESLEELRDLNKRQQNIDYESMLKLYATETPEQREERLRKVDEEYIKSVRFNSTGKKRVVAEEEIVEDDAPAKNEVVDLKPKADELHQPQSSNQTDNKVEKSENSTSTFVNKPIGKIFGNTLKRKQPLVKINSKVSRTDKVDKIETSGIAVKNEEDQIETENDPKPEETVGRETGEKNPASGLLLLGSYGSDSDSN